jgi:Flp pilus assembly protein TadG
MGTSFLSRLRRDRRGVSAVEFAIIALPLFGTIMAGIELGYRFMMLSRLDGAVKTAARMATTGEFTGTQIDAYVTEVASGIKGSTVTISKRSYDTFSAVAKPEPITSDTHPMGAYNIGDCYEDKNRNGVWDSASTSGYAGTGYAEDIIRYSATVTYPTLFPLLVNMAGFDSSARITATTVMQNEPYASTANALPPIRCN